MNRTKWPAIALIGPTASGKTEKAVALAEISDGEIISADSRQVYVGMDLGTGKDLDEYGTIQYHLIDICPAGSKYNLYRFLHDAGNALNDIRSRGKTPIVCGGTGMYAEALIKGMNLPEVPENRQLRESLQDKSIEELTAILSSMKALHNTTDVDTAKRAIRAIEIQTFYEENGIDPLKCNPTGKNVNESPKFVTIGIDIDREERRRRISDRLQSRIEAGMIEEVKGLLDIGIAPEDLIYYGLEYKFLTLFVLGRISYTEMYNQLEIAIHQFAKRQMTWFRGMERRGIQIHWIPFGLTNESFVNEVRKIIKETKRD